MKPTRFFALGGMQEIGKATHVTEYDDEIIIVDAGIKFANNIETGVEGIVPDYTYLKEKQKNILALFITHGHEDHIGGIPYLIRMVDIPKIYAPSIAIDFIKRRLKDMKIKTSVEFIEMTRDLSVKGKHMTVDCWTAQHSIPEAFGIRIKTPNGNILDTGDFRFDYSPIGNLTDFTKLEEMGKEGVDILTSDSTNSMSVQHSPTEQLIIDDINEHIKNTKGKVILTTFASNMHRVKLAIDLAAKNNRKVCLFGRSMVSGTEIGRAHNFIEVDSSVFVDKKDLSRLKDEEIMILCTGSQGEEFAALNQMASGKHAYVTLKNKDVVIFSSSPIPGNRQKIELLINKIYRMGADVKEHNIDGLLHISGHAYKDEHLKIFEVTKPKFFIPCHGFYRMSAVHAQTAIDSGVKAENTFIIENGRVVNLIDRVATVTDEVIESGPVYIDSGVATNDTLSIIDERTHLASNGFVNVIAKIDKERNNIIGRVRIISRGTLFIANSKDEMEAIQKLAHGTILYFIKNNDKWSEADIEKLLEQRIQSYFYKEKRRRPSVVFSLIDNQSFKMKKKNNEEKSEERY